MSRGYKTTCPECRGHNLYVTPDNGVEHCFNCGYTKGTRKESPEQLMAVSENLETIRSYYTKLAAYYHACLTPKARDYLHSRGISDRSISENLIGYCPSGAHSVYQEPIAREAGIAGSGNASVLAGRVIFPYVVNGQVVDLRGRSLDPDEETRYKGPYGRARFRGADEWPYMPVATHRGENSLPVVVTEGEIKALLCAQSGIPAVSVPGINSWKWRLRSLYSTRQRVIVFDSQADKAVAEHVYAAVDSLASRMGECHVLFLPLKGKKMDVDTFILTKGAEEFKLLLSCSLPYTSWAIIMRRYGHVPR